MSTSTTSIGRRSQPGATAATATAATVADTNSATTTVSRRAAIRALSSALVTLASILMAAATLSACDAGAPPEPDLERSVLMFATPKGFELDRVSHAPPPSMEPLMSGMTEPESLTMGYYQSTDDPARGITVTLASYSDDVGPLAAYNGWFAENAFMAAVDRTSLDLGDQAECFDVQWPAFHSVIARQGPLFALVEADTTVPREECHALMTNLLQGFVQ